MNAKNFTLISLILFFIPVLLGGFEFMPKALWSYRNSFYAIILLFLIFLKNNSFRTRITNILKFPEESLSQDKANYLIKIMQWVYLGIFLKLVVINYYTFNVVDVDFSYFDWMIANFVKGKGWFSPACNCNHFGVHSTYIFYILAPLHKLIGHPLFLVTLHALALWVSIFPLKKLIKIKNLLPLHQVLLVFGFFNLSAISHILKYNFHMEVFYVPAFLYLFLFLENRKWVLFYLTALFSLSIKEDAGFYLMGISAAMFLFNKNTKKHALALGTLAIIITGISLKVIIPHFRETTDYVIAGTASKYGSSMTDILINLLKNPITLIGEIIKGHWIRFLIPTLFMPLLVPFFVVSAAPFIIIHSIARSTLMHSLMLYYSAPYIPFIIYSFIVFLSGQYLFNKKYILKEHIKTYFLIFFILYGSLVGSGFLTFSPIKSDAHQFYNVEKIVKKESKVCAQGSIMPHFTYDYDLWPLPHCMGKNFDYLIFNPMIVTYPYNRDQINGFINKYSNDKSYKKLNLGNFVLFEKK